MCASSAGTDVGLGWNLRTAVISAMSCSEVHLSKGEARQGKARQGKARQGKARQGKARQGEVKQIKAR